MFLHIPYVKCTVIPVDSHVLPLTVLPQSSSDPVVEAAPQAACVGRADAGMDGLECCLSGSPG